MMIDTFAKPKIQPNTKESAEECGIRLEADGAFKTTAPMARKFSSL
ncbi:MAG: hypothetical protein GX433_05560 [Deltaproteobacteria bacterium]|jgi:hypothetical protein|nr:hypothetical protein [Deltaproteobacteria bacterium]